MNIEFTTRHFRAPENLKVYVEEEIQRISKVYERAIQCQVIIYRANGQEYTTEINLSIPQRKLNVKETTENVIKSVDRAVDKMITRVSKVKEKMNHF